MKAKIVPYNQERGNAIRNVLFVFELVVPVAPHAMADFESVTELHGKLKALLPKYSELQQVVMNLGPNGVAQQFQMPSLMNGCSFERFDNKGDIALGLNIQPGAITISCGDYNRWKSVHDSIVEILNLLAPWLLQNGVRTNNFVLQYVDEFSVSFQGGGDRSLCALFDVNSSYIVRNFENLQQEFHSHHGYFKDPEYKIAGRVLNNINIGVNFVGAKSVVQIQTAHKYQANAMLDIVDKQGVFSADLDGAFEYLHQENKQIIGELLTEEVKEMISFNSREV